MTTNQVCKVMGRALISIGFMCAVAAMFMDIETDEGLRNALNTALVGMIFAGVGLVIGFMCYIVNFVLAIITVLYLRFHRTNDENSHDERYMEMKEFASTVGYGRVLIHLFKGIIAHYRKESEVSR